ncbi:hypothetical protein [Gottfriedia sp. OAE603]
MKDSLYKILHLVCLIGIGIVLYRIGTKLDQVALYLYQLTFK